jgi:hypothetical protein
MEICMTRLATKEIKKMNKIRGRNKKKSNYLTCQKEKRRKKRGK